MPIHHVSDTAHWVAMYRALESERGDALFNDPYARHMAGQRGAAIAREVPLGDSMAWAIVVRTAVMDELILACIEQGAGTVLNLGAGLDTRAFRLALPPKLRWLDVDFPGMVTHRRSCLKGVVPACVHWHVSADLRDPAAVNRALAATSTGHGPMLVVSEGLLVYMESEQVSCLAGQLRAHADARWWLTDLVSPMLLGMVGTRWPSNEAAESAPFRFAPADSCTYFESHGWFEEDFRSTLDESVRLDRSPPMAQWWSAFRLPWWPGARENVRRMAGVALMNCHSVGD